MIAENLRSNDANEFIPTRQSLLSRLKDWDDHESWKVFFDTYWRLIYNAALKAGLSDAEAQDVVQETLISVSRSMPNFHYDPRRGSFKTWLMRLTGWRIKRQLEKRAPLKRSMNQSANRGSRTSTGTGTLEKIPDPAEPALEALWDEEWERNLMAAALERVKKRVDPKQYQIFDYCVLKTLPVSRVVRALNVNRGRVYLAKHRISKLIKQEITRLQTSRL
ncbi:MAG: sigma-70 family RNA polymerase sigma factor [Verrucomicrobiota bacterium]|jgi:RNA polymerase sigma-70 factor (ECF subfamily)